MTNTFQKYRVYILICLISIIVGSLCAVFWRKLSTQNELPKEFLAVKTEVNKQFPELEINKYSSSEKLTAYLSNKKVLLIVMSTSCGACKTEIDLLKSAQLLKNTGIEIALIAHEKEDLLKNFLLVNNLDLPIFDDQKSKMRDEFDLKVTPVNFLVENGTIKRMWNGSPKNIDDLYAKLGVTSE